MNAYNLWNTSQIHRFPDKYRTISPAHGGDANASKKYKMRWRHVPFQRGCNGQRVCMISGVAPNNFKVGTLGVTHRVMGSYHNKSHRMSRTSLIQE